MGFQLRDTATLGSVLQSDIQPIGVAKKPHTMNWAVGSDGALFEPANRFLVLKRVNMLYC
jgi:hypothetical protein